jgi:hypothetical protein
LALSVGFAALSALCAEATAQAPSLGEQGSVLACFYECKPDQEAQTWSEVTSLVLANLSPAGPGAILAVAILDGNGNIITTTRIGTGAEDLDEVNICRTLRSAGLPVPQAGLIEILVGVPPPLPVGPGIGVYAWVKNHVGKFHQDQDELFGEGNSVTGVAKTECRLVPPTVVTFGQLFNKIAQIPFVPPVLIEGTEDGD